LSYALGYLTQLEASRLGKLFLIKAPSELSAMTNPLDVEGQMNESILMQVNLSG